ncbi:unnamed protein product [Taenia asiatica]|uniref:G_PROTEIN_RECEP_F1_2 domain-containing protein n=1 Tax=Taenia asiatica TaxID=60517 RepID=A0A0R3W6P7_TAEAS|nr:unnamed protein product [Taenia asiatica]
MLYLHTLTQTIFSVCIGVPLAIIGVGANCFNLYLFHQDNVTSRATRLLLVSVSISEIIFLALTAIYCTAKICHFKNFTRTLCSALLFYLLNVLELVRNWLLVLLGIERLLHFVKPLEFRLIWSRKTVALAVSLITGFACLVRLPSLIYNLHDKVKAISLKLVRNAYMSHLVVDCVLLALLPECIMIYRQFTRGMWALSDGLAALTNFCSILNSVMNFFIYVGHSPRYRGILAEMLSANRLAKAKEGNTGAECALSTYSRAGGYQDSQEATLPNRDTLVELLSGPFAKTERFTKN